MGILALCAAALGLYLGKFIPKKTRYMLFKFAMFCDSVSFDSFGGKSADEDGMA